VDPAASPHRHPGLVRGIYVPTVLHAVGYSMLAPALPLHARDLALSLGAIGLLSTVQGVASLSANLPTGFGVARFGGRPMLLAGLGLAAVGSVGLAVAGSGGALFLAVPWLGAGTATWGTARLAYTADLVPPLERGRVLATVGGVSRIGLAIGPFVGGVLGDAFGLRTVFVGHAVCAGLAWLLVASVRADAAASGGRAPAGAGPGLAATLLASRRAFATAGAVAFALATLRAGRVLLVPLWGAALGLSFSQIGFVIGAAAIVDMSLFVPVGRVMDRFGRKWTFVPCMLVLAASLALYPWTGALGAYLAVAVLGGFGNGLGAGAIMTLGADLAPRHAASAFLGAWRTVAELGGIVAPALAGGLAQSLSLAAAFPALAAIGVAGALLMAFRVPEGLQRGRTLEGA